MKVTKYKIFLVTVGLRCNCFILYYPTCKYSTYIKVKKCMFGKICLNCLILYVTIIHIWYTSIPLPHSNNWFLLVLSCLNYVYYSIIVCHKIKFKDVRRLLGCVITSKHSNLWMLQVAHYCIDTCTYIQNIITCSLISTCT